MAKRTTVELVDDLDGNEGDETVLFGLDGVEYEIDLSKEHADELREALSPFVGSGRRRPATHRAAVQQQLPGAGRRKDLADVRAWANENGFEVSARGRIPIQVMEAYDVAH